MVYINTVPFTIQRVTQAQIDLLPDYIPPIFQIQKLILFFARLVLDLGSILSKL